MRLANRLLDQSAAPAGIGDNVRAIEEGERVQLLSFVSQLTKANAEVERAKAPFEAAKKARTQIFRLGRAAGFQRQHLEDYLERMGDGTRDNAEDEIRRRRHYRWLGILDQDQVDMFAGDAAPASAKDEVHWRAEGYKAGLRALEPKPPAEAGTWSNAWLEDHARGMATMREAIAANAPKPMKPKPTAKEIGEKAAADFKADNPPQKAELPNPEDVEAAARRLKASQFMEGAPKPSGANLAK